MKFAVTSVLKYDYRKFFVVCNPTCPALIMFKLRSIAPD
jgi:hypothetical protein